MWLKNIVIFASGAFSLDMSIFYLFLVLTCTEAVWIARRFANRADGWANPGNKKRRPKDEFNGKDSTLKQERKKQSKTKHSKQKKWVSHQRGSRNFPASGGGERVQVNLTEEKL